jgi:predicted GNAT family N-acyltransferase
MAVLQGMRGTRVGRQVLDALLAAARVRGDQRAVLDAQTSAAGFYARAGFAAVGEPFDEVGIAHVRMERAL